MAQVFIKRPRPLGLWHATALAIRARQGARLPRDARRNRRAGPPPFRYRQLVEVKWDRSDPRSFEIGKVDDQQAEIDAALRAPIGSPPPNAT